MRQHTSAWNGPVRAWSLAADPTRPERVFLGSSSSVFRSDDGGRSWSLASGDPAVSARGVRSIAVSAHGDGHVWYTVLSADDVAESAIVRSRDGGITWDTAYSFGGCGAIVIERLVADPRVPNRVWAMGHGQLVRSDDGGDTWNTVQLPTSGAVLTVIAACGEMAVTTYETSARDERGAPIPEGTVLYVTQDGQRWIRLPIPEGVQLGSGMISHPEGGLVGGTEDAGVWRVMWGFSSTTEAIEVGQAYRGPRQICKA